MAANPPAATAAGAKEKGDDYDPYQNYEVERPISYWDALFHMVKGAFGTGILAMPLALRHAGWVLGTIGTLVLGFLVTYCIHLLARTEYEGCKRRKIPNMSYSETAKVALEEGPPWLKKCSPYALGICNAFLLMYHLGACCVYIVFVAENLEKVIMSQKDYFLDKRWITAILMAPLIGINLIRNLKYLAPVSLLANVLQCASCSIIYYYVFSKGINNFNERHATGELRNYPKFFATVAFALESIGVIMSLKNDMKEPARFKSTFGVVNVGMAFIVTLYTFTGLFGYLAYGEEILPSITLNVGGKKATPADVCKILYGIAIFFSHALYLYIPVELVYYRWLMLKLEKRRLLWEYVIRIGFTIFTVLVAIAIPYIGLFIDLVGALALSMLGFTFPAIMDSSIKWNDLKGLKKWYVHIKNGTIAIIGVVGLVVGTYITIEDIAKAIKRDMGGGRGQRTE